MNILQCETWARRVRNTGWYGDLRALGHSVRASRSDSGRLLVVGHPDDQPWHLTAHLELLATFRQVPELHATLARPELDEVSRHDSLLVVTEQPLPEGLLSRLEDARHGGSTVFGLSTEPGDLAEVANESVSVDPGQMSVLPGIAADFELAGHFFSVAAATKPRVNRRFGARLLRRSS